MERGRQRERPRLRARVRRRKVGKEATVIKQPEARERAKPREGKATVPNELITKAITSMPRLSF